MKLRLYGASLRLRLRRPEVEALMKTGEVRSELPWAPAGAPGLDYGVRLSEGARVALVKAGGLWVAVPRAVAQAWAAGSAEGLYGEEPWGLKIAVEKDYPCLHPPSGESNEGAFERSEAPAGSQG